MGSHKIKDLVRIGDTFYFRKAIPRSLTRRLGIREYKRSLKTKSLALARYRCRQASNYLEQFFEFVERMTELKQEQLLEIANSFFQTLLEEGNEKIYCIDNDPSESRSENALALEKIISEYKTKLAAGDVAGHLYTELDNELLKYGHMDVPRDSDTYRILLGYFMRGETEAKRILRAKLQNDYSQTTPQDPIFSVGVVDTLPPIVDGTVESVGEEHSLGVLTKKFIQAHSEVWAPKTVMDYKRVMCWSCDLFGEGRLPHTLGNKDIVAWRDFLLTIPSNYSKYDKDIAVREAIKKYADRKKISPRTVDKYLGFFRTFLSWCENEGYVDHVPGKKVKVIYKSTDKPRMPFDQNDLLKLFSSPMWTGFFSRARRSRAGKYIKRDANYWIPLVAVYTGMRCGEIVQLRFEDIVNEEGVDYFDVNSNHDKTLKTKYSNRRIPIHPFLRKIGFMDFIEGRKSKHAEERLFHEISISVQGDPSNAYSKYFSRYLKNIGLKKDDLTFHSTRHSFLDALDDASVSEVHKKLLMGHSDKSASAQYGTGGKIQVLFEQISQIQYDFEPEFLTDVTGLVVLKDK